MNRRTTSSPSGSRWRSTRSRAPRPVLWVTDMRNWYALNSTSISSSSVRSITSKAPACNGGMVRSEPRNMWSSPESMPPTVSAPGAPTSTSLKPSPSMSPAPASPMLRWSPASSPSSTTDGASLKPLLSPRKM